MKRAEMNGDIVKQILPIRKQDTHKGDYGRILLLCGSQCYTGAPALAAMGALRSGAGLVYLGVPKCIYQIEASRLLEPVIYPLEDHQGGFAASVVSQLGQLLSQKDAVLIGPGIGCSQGAFAVVKYVLENFEGPVVLDADGINVLSGHIDLLRDRAFPTILTPHPGEFARLGGDTGADRPVAAAQLAQQLGCVVVLKGHGTVTTDGERYYVNRTGNPGMATGGSGDVLAGMIVSLLGQGIPALEAAACSVWLHGAAADDCAARSGQYGMLPQDMLDALPRLLP